VSLAPSRGGRYRALVPAAGQDPLDPSLVERLRGFASTLSGDERRALEERLGVSLGDAHPDLHRALLDRPRLRTLIARRHEVPLTLLVAGAGFGKTTLLAQSLGPADARNLDLHIPLTAAHTPARILDAALEQLGHHGRRRTTVERLGEAIWSSAPRHVCLVLDDLHRLAAAEADGLVADLLGALPTNGHLLVASRRPLGIPLERLRLDGRLTEIAEADLAFTDDEIEAFVRSRGTPDVALARTRWPALLELECTTGVANAERYLDEEILSLLPDGRRRALARLSIIRTIDDELVRAVTSFDGSVDALVDGLPLVSCGPGRSVTLHDLWVDVLARDLSPAERRDCGAIAARVLRDRGDPEDAAMVSVLAGDDEGLLATLRRLALDYAATHTASLWRRVLGAVPEHLVDRPEVSALAAALVFATEPVRARGPLLDAVACTRQADDSELELTSLVRLAELEFRTTGVEPLTVIGARLDELVHAGRPGAEGARSLVQAWHSLLCARYDDAARQLADPTIASFPAIVDIAEYYRRCWWGWVGDARRALAALDEHELRVGRYAGRRQVFRALLRWHLGQLDGPSRDALIGVLDETTIAGERHLMVESTATVALFHLSAGDVSTAARLVADAEPHADALDEGNWGRIALQQARAVLALYDGREQDAANLIRSAFPHHGAPEVCVAHVFTNTIALSYVLVPETAAAWDAVELGPDMAVGRDVGRALRAARSGDLRLASQLRWEDVDRLRTWAYEPHLAELAVAAVAAGEDRARDALASLRFSPTRELTALTGHATSAVSRTARGLLGTVSHRPSGVLTIRVLGPLTLERDGLAVHDAALRHQRVRQLLAVLVHHRHLSRRTAMLLMWPDLGESAASNNLRVTLSKLNRVLEPGRPRDARPWYLRSIGDELVLDGGDRLVLDVDEFRRACDRARAADARGHASDALEAYADACSWYAGDYLTDAESDDLVYLEQIHHRREFVTAATRSAELLTAAGRPAEARQLAMRVIAEEPLSDDGHVAVAQTYVAEGRLHEASEVFVRFFAQLAADGLHPTEGLREAADRVAAMRREPERRCP
jgi:LuxR family maltose regulon positive regulatory protein